MDAGGREQVDVLAWGRQEGRSDGSSTSTSDRSPAGRAVTRDTPKGPPDERHKVIIASSMITGALWLALVALVIGFIPPLGPVALIGGLVAVWVSLIARVLIGGSGDLEVAGPVRNVLLGILAAIVGAVSTALLVAMLRGGDVAAFVVCFGKTTEPSECWVAFARAAVERVGW